MYERFMQLLQENGITSYRVYKDTGIPQATLSDWKRGKSVPKYENLLKIANYFGVTVEWIRGNSDEKKPLVNNDEELTEYLEELKTRPEMRMLFSITKNATKKDVEQAVAIIEALKRQENNE